jgi:hypothetical protein
MFSRTTLAAVGTLALASQAAAQTVDEVIARYLAARGGVAQIKAIQTQRMAGTIAFGNNETQSFRVEMKRPGKMRQEIGSKTGTIIQTTTGDAGWSLLPPNPAVPLPPETLRNMAGGADIDGPLMDYKSKGNRVELAGKAKIDGKDAYKLIVSLKDGQVRTDYIDCDSLMEMKWEGKLGQKGKEYAVESYFRNYRKVNGVMYAFTVDSETLGTRFKQKIVFEKIEVNVPIPDTDFGKP